MVSFEKVGKCFSDRHPYAFLLPEITFRLVLFQNKSGRRLRCNGAESIQRSGMLFSLLKQKKKAEHKRYRDNVQYDSLGAATFHM